MDSQKAASIKVEEAIWLKEKDLVEFKMIVESYGKVKDVEFELNLLEDTEVGVAKEMVRDLQLPKELTDFTTQLIRNEVARIMKERESMKWQELFDKGKLLQRNKKYVESERIFSILLDSFNPPTNKSGPIPNRPVLSKGQVIMLLADACYKLGKYIEARQLYDDYSQLPDHGKEKNGELLGQIKIAKVFMKQSKFKDSEILLKGIINRPPKQLDGATEIVDYCRKALVKVYELQGKLYESEMLYKRPLDEIWSSFQTLEKNAEKLMMDGSFEQAQDLFKDELKLKSEALPILQCLAELYTRHNKFVESLECYQKCLELKEKLNDSGHFSLADTLNCIAKVYQVQKQYEKAEETFIKALKISEMALQTTENLMQKLTKENASDKLKTVMSRLPEIKSVLLLTLGNLIRLHGEMGNPDEVELFKQKLADFSSSARTLGSSGGSGSLGIGASGRLRSSSISTPTLPRLISGITGTSLTPQGSPQNDRKQ